MGVLHGVTPQTKLANGSVQERDDDAALAELVTLCVDGPIAAARRDAGRSDLVAARSG